MKSITRTLRTVGPKITVVGIPLLVGASGTAAAHGGSRGFGGGIMGGLWGGMTGLGVFGGGMFLWPLVLLLVYGTNRGSQLSGEDTALIELRERYARGELSDEEFEARRATLTQ